jgi:hypothetical protein
MPKQTNDKHIIEVLDNAAVESLSESELSEIRVHAEACVSCRSAYEAARLSAVVLRTRAEATIEPSPFFQTRVMAALREQQAVENVPAMFRLWKSARALVSSMAVTTAALAALSFIVPAPVASVVDQTASADSAESVILGQSNDEITYEQVLNTIYDDDVEAR